MSTLIDLTGLSRFLYNCKNMFSRKAVTIQGADETAIPRINIGSNSSYIISVYDMDELESESIFIQMIDDVVTAVHLNGLDITTLMWDDVEGQLYVYPEKTATSYHVFTLVIYNINGNRVTYSQVSLSSVTGSSVTIQKPTDTKNTTGASNSSSKLYLVGAASQTTAPVTYSNSTLYIDNTQTLVMKDARIADKDLYIGSASNSQCHQQYDSTNNCLKFIFD